MSSNMPMVVGLIGLIVVVSLILAAYSPVMGSVAEDARVNNVTNSSHAASYSAGTGAVQGFMGLNEAEVFILFILLIVAVILLMWVL